MTWKLGTLFYLWYMYIYGSWIYTNVLSLWFDLVTKLQGVSKSDTLLGFLSLVRCITIAIFVYSRIIFIKWRHSSSADVNRFCVFMRINCNFVIMVWLAIDWRCLIHNLRVEKQRGCDKIFWKCFRTNEHIWTVKCEQLTANVKVFQTINIRCFTVHMALYWRSKKGCHVFWPTW